MNSDIISMYPDSNIYIYITANSILRISPDILILKIKKRKERRKKKV